MGFEVSQIQKSGWGKRGGERSPVDLTQSLRAPPTTTHNAITLSLIHI